jgi:hypothetical protein
VRVKYWEIIADNLKKAGSSWGACQPLTRMGERSGLPMCIATESVSVVRADEKLMAFLELEAAIAATANVEETTWQTPEPWAS